MSKTFESTVRPFQVLGFTPATIVPEGTEAAEPVVCAFVSKGGAKTFNWSFSTSSTSPTNDTYRELSRVNERVKVTNPNDPDQFVEVDRVKQVTLFNETDPSLKRVYKFKE